MHCLKKKSYEVISLFLIHVSLLILHINADKVMKQLDVEVSPVTLAQCINP